MALADWIMRSATSNPPAGREHWAQAMRAEYASLHIGQLSWALGCWKTMLGWRLREDGALALVGTVVLLDFSTFWMWLVEIMPRGLSHVLLGQLDINLWLALMLIGAIALNALKPTRPFVTSLTLITMQHVGFAVDLLTAPPTFQEQFSRGPYHIYNSPPFVAVLAEVGACVVGAMIARLLVSVWRRIATKSQRRVPA